MRLIWMNCHKDVASTQQRREEPRHHGLIETGKSVFVSLIREEYCLEVWNKGTALLAATWGFRVGF